MIIQLINDEEELGLYQIDPPLEGEKDVLEQLEIIFKDAYQKRDDESLDGFDEILGQQGIERVFVETINLKSD